MTRDRCFVSKAAEPVSWSVEVGLDKRDSFVTREDAPTKREGRKISRRQWKRQNAKSIRKNRKARHYLAAVSRRVSEELDRQFREAVLGGMSVSFQDTVLTEDKLIEMGLLPAKPKPPITRWNFHPMPVQIINTLFAGAYDS